MEYEQEGHFFTGTGKKRKMNPAVHSNVHVSNSLRTFAGEACSPEQVSCFPGSHPEVFNLAGRGCTERKTLKEDAQEFLAGNFAPAGSRNSKDYRYSLPDLVRVLSLPGSDPDVVLPCVGIASRGICRRKPDGIGSG